MIEWLQGQSWLQGIAAAIGWTDVFWFALLFVATLTLSLAEVTFLLVKLPADYFLSRSHRTWLKDRHWAVRLLAYLVKNLVGLLHVLLGVVLSLPGVPGQGALTILIGIMMLDLPGVRWLENKLVRQSRIQRTINRLRARFNKPPLVLDPAPSLRSSHRRLASSIAS